MRLYANKMEVRDVPAHAATVTVYGPAQMPLEAFCDQLGQLIGDETIKSDGPPAHRNGLPSFRFHYLAGHPLCRKAQANYKAGLPERWMSLQEFASWAGRSIGPTAGFAPCGQGDLPLASGAASGAGGGLLMLVLLIVGFIVALATR